MKIVGLLLAAGSASRFGSDKLRHALPHGVQIAVQSARHLKSQVDVFAVVRPGSEEISQALKDEGCQVVICDNAAEGMGASLACAVRASEGADAWLVALADMPFVRPSSIAAVRAALEGGATLVAPFFRARRGHPVGIAAKYRQDLLSLAGDEGAKALLSRHGGDLLKIPVGDPGVIRDIDRPEDLAPPLRV
ncbi:MAG: molybdenum cofactor cytidylyltransferase [Betaproteobacteria bacterium]|nr:molybdenum cofactor cytidylyltransferase [Betaproteobacteria bacterium]